MVVLFVVLHWRSPINYRGVVAVLLLLLLMSDDDVVDSIVVVVHVEFVRDVVQYNVED
jgi:hypothetical protein